MVQEEETEDGNSSPVAAKVESANEGEYKARTTSEFSETETDAGVCRNGEKGGGGGGSDTDEEEAVYGKYELGDVENNDYYNLSPSELAVLENTIHVPRWLKFIEKPFQVKNDKGDIQPEVTGWSMDAAARGPLNILGTYIGACLLTLASDDAGCDLRQPTCDKKIYGMKPSSLLTLVTGAVTLLAAVAMPMIGALVDRTRHRKTVGIFTAAVVVIATGVQISINQNNWFIILCFEVIGGIALIMHTTSVFSYMPDLSRSESVLVKYSTGFHIRKFACMTFFSLSSSVFSFLTRKRGQRIQNQIRLCKFSASVAFTLSFILLGYSWIFCFRKRPPLQEKTEGRSLVRSGVTSLKRSWHKIFACISNYKALKWLLIAMLFSPEAGAGTVLSIATTFMTIYLKMSALQLSIAVLLLQVFNIFGSLISKILCDKINPFVSYRISLATFAISSALTAITLNSDRINLLYIFACIWGIAFGCFYATQRVLFCMLIPKGKQFEFMGFFMFFGNLLGWLPPIIFTFMNEKNVDMRLGMGILPIFGFISLLCTFMMGSHEDALKAVQAMDEDSDFESDVYSTSQSATRRSSVLSYASNTDRSDIAGGCRRSPAYRGPGIGDNRTLSSASKGPSTLSALQSYNMSHMAAVKESTKSAGGCRRSPAYKGPSIDDE